MLKQTLEGKGVGTVMNFEHAYTLSDWGCMPLTPATLMSTSKNQTWLTTLELIDSETAQPSSPSTTIIPPCLSLVIGHLPTIEIKDQSPFKLQLKEIVSASSLFVYLPFTTPYPVTGWCNQHRQKMTDKSCIYSQPHPWFRALLTDLHAVSGSFGFSEIL